MFCQVDNISLAIVINISKKKKKFKSSYLYSNNLNINDLAKKETSTVGMIASTGLWLTTAKGYHSPKHSQNLSQELNNTEVSRM